MPTSAASPLRHTLMQLVRRRTSIMRAWVGALGFASFCLVYLLLGFSPVQGWQRKDALLIVDVVAVHEPIVAGPYDILTTKYFHEPVGHQQGDDKLLGHYDIRYFTGQQVSYSERRDALHHMIRAYLSSFRKLNLETWLAHGTLLGWWWGAQILPWDWDLDVQVTGETMDIMGQRFNGTVHSYKSSGVERRFLLDINPNFKMRVHGDGMNIIDARWIDMSNGLYIDITGISKTQPDSPNMWSCKNYHDYLESDIWPLQESVFEGVPARVPRHSEKVLADEYTNDALKLTNFEGHYWNEKVEKWISNEAQPDPQIEPFSPDNA